MGSRGGQNAFAWSCADEKGDRSPDVERDEKGQPTFALLVNTPAQNAGQEHGVAEAAHRKQFRYALQDADDDRVDKGHVGSNAF